MYRKASKMLTGVLSATIIMSLALSGCGNGVQSDKSGETSKSAPAKEQPAKAEPVTVKLFLSMPIEDSDLNKLIIEPTKKKYPNITIEPTKTGKGTQLTDLIASGDMPDIIFTWNGALPSFKETDMLYDITPLAKKQNLDLGRFEPVVLDAIRSVSEKGELYALPIALNFCATYYNKDIFDKFGVPYPKDGMTWSDAVELGKRLTRTDGGIQYRGLDPDNVSRIGMPLSLTFVDFKTAKATINNDSWKRAFTLAKEIWSIPGNQPTKLNTPAKNVFMKEKTLAMLPVINLLNQGMEEAQQNGLNWDLAQYPSYKEKPNTYGYVDTHLLTITKPSKHKDAAMQVLETVTSDEVQLLGARSTARLSPLKNPEMKKQFGADMPFLKGKHLEGIFKSSPAKAPAVSEFNNKAKQIAFQSFEEYFNGKDLNTALSEADEKINQMIDTSKSK